ncbi:MAG: energy transducer TonB [Terriglobales bacterium]
MDSQPSQLTLGLLPESGTRWERFVLSYGVQSAVVAFFVIMAIAYPEVLVLPVHDYHFISLVSTPPLIPQTPAPVRNFPTPAPKIVEAVAPRPDAMVVPAELVRKKAPEEQAPKVTLAAKVEVLPEMKPLIPRPPVKTNVFSSGSSATPTMAAAPSKVQTGGFGDPNGVPASDNHGRPVTIAQLGSIDMPYGPGSGNGTGGARGARGVVASAGFGSGVATGNGSGVSGSRAVVHQGAFGDADVVAASQPKVRTAAPVVDTLPVEITYKPRPVYTDEGRQLKIQGEVLLDVVFAADGQIRIKKVVRGLGHGLDESAVRAAEKIQFKPALRDGHPADYEAVLHIEFELAS